MRSLIVAIAALSLGFMTACGQDEASAGECQELGEHIARQTLVETGHTEQKPGTTGDLVDSMIRDGWRDMCVHGKWSKKRVKCYLSSTEPIEQAKQRCGGAQ